LECSHASETNDHRRTDGNRGGDPGNRDGRGHCAARRGFATAFGPSHAGSGRAQAATDKRPASRSRPRTAVGRSVEISADGIEPLGRSRDKRPGRKQYRRQNDRRAAPDLPRLLAHSGGLRAASHRPSCRCPAAGRYRRAGSAIALPLQARSHDPARLVTTVNPGELQARLGRWLFGRAESSLRRSRRVRGP
jgi:hypothetical protein